MKGLETKPGPVLLQASIPNLDTLVNLCFTNYADVIH